MDLRKWRDAAIAVAFVMVLLLIGGYGFDLPWIGFSDYTYTKPENQEFQRGKTVWDWMQLLIVPAILAIGGYVFNRTEKERDAERARVEKEREQNHIDQRVKSDREIANNNLREAALQGYLDRMTELLVDKQLRQSDPDSEVRAVARARTLTVLGELDDVRKGSLLRFLYEAKLISGDRPVIELGGASLNSASLSSFNLYEVNLSGANLGKAWLLNARLQRAQLSKANLSGAYLSRINLNDANLDSALLCKANLTEATLVDTSLVRANLSDARLSGAILTKADLKEANLTNAKLGSFGSIDFWGNNDRLVSGAILAGADLRGATLIGADLTDVDLSDADLLNAEVTADQLSVCRSTSGARLPHRLVYFT